MDLELQPGDCLADRYVILEEIGRGGFGVVYRAVQEGVNRHVALKTIRHQVADIQGFDFIEAFRREALLTSKLKHPNTITLFDYGETKEGTLYLVTEFLDGETLYERLWREKEMSPEVAVHVAKQIAKSLGEAHSHGIIHGDLKPANIFLCQMYGEQDFVKVLDFGIAKIIGEVDPAGLGTPEYMSPEQFSGQPLMAASDVYSLGLIIYEMLIGTRPFEDKDTQKLAQRHLAEPLPQMPDEIERSELGMIIRRATAKEPDRRYDNGMTFFKALDAVGAVRRHEVIRLPPAIEPAELASPSSAPRNVRPRSDHTDPRPSDRITSSGGARESIEAPLPMTGRESERHWLFARLDGTIKTRQGRIVLIGGAAGSGKTRLCQWLLSEVDKRQAQSGTGAFRKSSPRVMEAPAQALAQALGFSRREGMGPPAGKIEEAVAARIGRALSSVERNAICALYAQMPVDPATFDPRPLAVLLMELANARPLVLHIDNIRWADTTSLALFEALAEGLDKTPSPLLLLLTVRRETLPGLPELSARLKNLARQRTCVMPWFIPEMTRIDAREFSRLALQAAAEAAGILGAPTQSLVEAITERSGGNPLYILQLVQHLIKNELLSATNNGIQLTPGVIIEALIPARIGQLMRSRLNQLLSSEQDHRALDTILTRMALLGRNVPHGLLQTTLKREAEAGNIEAAQTLARLKPLSQRLAEQDIILIKERVDKEGHTSRSLSIAQHLMHQVLVERLEALPNAEELHRHAAVALQRHYGANETLEAHVEAIGSHFELAGDRAEAVRFLLRAARNQGLDNKLSEAAELLERCRSLCANEDSLADSRLRIIVSLSYLKLVLGAFADFEALQVLGMRLAEEIGDTEAIRELTLQAGIMAMGAGRLEQADALLEAAQKGFEHREQVAPAAALTPEEQGLSLVGLWLSMQPLKTSVGLSTTLLYRSRVQREMFHLRNADAFLKRAAECFHDNGLRWGLACCHRLLGSLTLERGNVQRAFEILEHATKLFSEVRPSTGLVDAKLNLAAAIARRGQPTPARELLMDLLARFGDLRQPRVARCHALLGQTLDSLGHSEEAQEHFERAIELSRVHGARLTLLRCLLDYAWFALDQSMSQRAHSLLNEAIKIARSSKARLYTPELQLLLGRLDDLCGRPQEAMEWYARSQRLTSTSGHQISFIKAHALTARLVQGDNAPLLLSAAFIHLKEALHLSEEIGAVIDGIFRAEEAVAAACHRSSRLAQANDLLDHAISGWHHIGNGVEVQRLQDVRTRSAP